jgi:hypothetical protein
LNGSSQGISFDSDGRTTFNTCRGYLYIAPSLPSHWDKTLYVIGKVVGEIDVVCPVNYGEKETVPQLKLLEVAESMRATSMLVGHSIPEVGQDEWLKRVLAVIIAYGRHLDAADDVEIDKMLRACQNYDHIVRGDDTLEDRIDLDQALRELTRKMKFYPGRKVFRGTHTSILGLGPHKICGGDMICVIQGSKVPLILRKRWSQYTVIGQCYYKKWMYGDLVDWKENEADIFELV